MKKLSLAVLFSLSFSVSALAQTTAPKPKTVDTYAMGANRAENDEPSIHIPVNFAVFPYLGVNDSMGGFSQKTLNNISFNMFVGHGYGLQGVEWAGLANWQERFLTGLQFAGIANLVGDRLDWGGQFAGIGNYSGNNTLGFQAAGIGNYTGNDRMGFQIAGIGNYTGGDSLGFQSAGIGNYAGGNTEGLQIAGISNFSNGDFTGGQIGLLNINLGATFLGGQIGLVNITTGHLKGLQLGLVNYADDIDGAPIGLVNIVRKSKIGIKTLVNEVGLTSVELRTGGKHIYSNLSFGYRPRIGSVANQYAFGLGLGGHIPINERFFVDIEGLSQSLKEQFSGNHKFNMLNTLRLKGGWKATDIISLIGGASLNVQVQAKDAAKLAPFSIFKNDSVTIWPGLFIGLEY